MASVVPHNVDTPPVGTVLTRKDLDSEDDGAQPRLLLHIACQAGGQILAGLPTRYLCGAPVRVLLGAVAPGDSPDGPGVCPVCAALERCPS
jgi:hypothetical protein